MSEAANEDSLLPFINYKLESLEFNKICRLCLSEKPSMQSLFESYLVETIADMLATFASMQITSGDGLPEYVCNGCSNLIEQCYIFKQQCERSESILKNLISQGNSDHFSQKLPQDDLKLKNETEFDNLSESGSLSIEQLSNFIDENDSNFHNEIIVDTLSQHKSPKCRKKRRNVGRKQVISSQSAKELICETCGERFFKQKDFENHQTSHIELLKLSCEICFKVFTDKRRLGRHKKTHLIEKPYPCEVCKKTFTELSSLRRHMQNHNLTSSFPFPCPNCHLGFTSEIDLHIHSAIHSDDEKHVCYECKKEFPTLLKLRRHVRTHLIDKPHKCDICQKGFPEKSSLTRHLRKHNGQPLQKSHVCTECGKGYIYGYQLQTHIRSHTGERPYVCAVCGKRFIDIRLLNSHMRMHSEIRPHACNYCNKTFRHEPTLKSHIRVHTGEKPFICNLCGKRFKQSSNLSLHLKRHRGEKPFSCEACGKRFTSSSTLTMHSRVHTGEKPYECKICKKRFARFNMVVHMRTHTGEKPFPCMSCSKKFPSQSQLRKHAKIHSYSCKPHTCPTCGKGFVIEYHLKKHMMTHQRRSKKKTQSPEQSQDEPVVMKAKLVPIIRTLGITKLLKRKINFITTNDNDQVTTLHLEDDPHNEQLVEMAQVISVEDISEDTLNIVTVTTSANGEISVSEECQLQSQLCVGDTENEKIFQLDNPILRRSLMP